ncbi:unnamed protein product [Orchesella dallaii]|uniref:Uncharacterized protein n=1 Tax=Orchesella dallaii TaxID=48710 RepID=A0ABP1RZG4_9HEXA
MKCGKWKEKASTYSCSFSSSTSYIYSGGSSRSSTSRSIPGVVDKKLSHLDVELHSNGGNGSVSVIKRKLNSEESTSGTRKQANKSDADGSKTKVLLPPGTASSKSACSAQSMEVEVLKKKYKLKDPIIKLQNLSKLMNNRVHLNDMKSDLKLFGSSRKAKKTESPKSSIPLSQQQKVVAFEGKMGGLSANTEVGVVIQKKKRSNRMTSAEVLLLRTRLREKVNQFRMEKLIGRASQNLFVSATSARGVDSNSQPLKTDKNLAETGLLKNHAEGGDDIGGDIYILCIYLPAEDDSDVV